MKKSKSRLLILGLSILSSVTILNSCVNNDDTSITEPTRYTAADIQSYADLFDVFWKTMDQRYNYFYEQKRVDGMDWNAIYKEYYPKFKALKTFGRATEMMEKLTKISIKRDNIFQRLLTQLLTNISM